MPYSTDCNSSPSEFPESIVTVTLEFGPYLRADGSPVAQPISITPSVEVLDIDSGAVIMALRPVTLRESQTQVILPATDSPGLLPIDFTYQVTVGGVPKVVSLPMAHPVVDFDLLVSSEPSPGTIIWHPPTLPSGGGDGDVLAWADVEDGGTRWMSPGEWPGVQRSEEAAHQAGEAAQRAEDARDGMVVGGTVDGDDLLLSTVGGDTIVAGNVRGQKGDPGTASPEFLAGVQAAQDAQAGAEEARDEAEQSASQADASKTAAETAQGLAEGARTGAETARVAAEAARDTALAAVPHTIVGAGRPDILATLDPDVATRVNAATSGTVFRSLDGPQGAWEWRKRGTAWVCEVGDTGQIDCTSLLNATAFKKSDTLGVYAFRRTGVSVTVMFRVRTLTALAARTLIQVGRLPSWAQAISYTQFASGVSNGAPWWVGSESSPSQLHLRAGDVTVLADAALSNQFSYSTNAAWPTTLAI